MCLPNNCDRMRYWYKEILAEFAESTILDFILGTIMRTQGKFPKFSDNLAEKIRQSNYAIS